jgi:aldose 1-epimerase
MSIETTRYGKIDGREIDQYTLTNRNGLRVKVIGYGATIASVEVPDRNGKLENVTLYRDSLDDYRQQNTSYFGAAVGRYGNRIAQGRFKLDGKEYTLATNNGANHLHGGKVGFDKVVWSAKPLQDNSSVGVVFAYESPDGEEGYPGTLSAKVTYSLTDDNELKMKYDATTDKPTILNLANHAYWNLAGAGSGDVLDHVIMLNSDRYLPVDAGLIPTGELKAVENTPMDFTRPKTIGSRLKEVKGEDPQGGYDHCYVLRRTGDDKGRLVLAAKVSEPTSGRVMEILTTQPAVQFYTGNFLDGTITAGGKTYKQHYAFCLETEHYPDSPNHSEFPSTVLRPGKTYHEVTLHKFSVKNLRDQTRIAD